MKITGFHANNYLSFQDFHLNDIDNNLNILVGPNGAGKSNVLYAIEQVVGSASNDVSIEEFMSDCNFNDVDDYAEIALDVEFDDKKEQALLANYICYSLFSESGLQNFLASGTNRTNQLNRERLRSFVNYMEKQILGSPLLSGIYIGTICVRLSDALYPSFSVYYRFQLQGKEFLWYLHGSYSNVIGVNLFKNRSQGWSQTEIWNAWINSLSDDTTIALKQWLTDELDEIPQIAFDFASTMSQGDNTSLYSLGGMNNHMGTDPEVPSYMYLRKSLGDINDSTTPIRSATVFGQLFRDTVIKTANIHVEPRKQFDYTEWDNPSSSLLDGSGLALHLFRLKNGSKSEREEFSRIRNTFSKLTNGRKLDVQLKNVVEYTDSLTTVHQPLTRFRLKPTQRRTPTVPTRESKAILHLEIITLDQHDREFPISRSGAGIFELAFLGAVLSVSKSHIVLLDEPGVHVHARIQRQLAQLLEQTGAQIFVATHSPYLISSKTLKHTRRIHMDAGCSKVSSAFRPSDNPNFRLKSEQAFERNTNRANALFSDLAILVDGESEYHALPIWYEKYLDKKAQVDASLRNSGRLFDDFNIILLFVGGKKTNPSYLRFVTAFDVKWMLLCDGDSLGVIDNVVKQLNEFEININENLSFCETKKELWAENVFVLGQSEQDNFETIPEVEPFLEEAKEKFGKSKALSAQWIAEQTECPEVLMDFFDRVIQLLPNV